MAGKILPEFFSKAGELIDVPAEFGEVLRAAVRGATCVACTHQHYLTAPKVVVTSPIVLPDWRNSFATGSSNNAPTESETECAAALPKTSSQEVG
jgi:hypothetical protein